MPPAPGTPSTARDNTLRAPFPRTNATRSPLSARRPPTTTSASANRKAVPATAPPQRITMPSTSSMGPPPPAGRRNERFDQMFYKSPLPRSISRAYNDLQAAGSGGVTAVTAAPRTAAIVPSALRRIGVVTGRITAPRKVSAGPSVSVRNSPRRAVAATVVEEDVAIAATATATAATATATVPDRAVPSTIRDLPTLVPPTLVPPTKGEGEVVAEEDEVVTERDGKLAEKDVPPPPPPPPAVRSFAEAWAREDDAFMQDVSDDDKAWHPLAQKVIEPAVKQGSKRPGPSSGRPTPPKKVAKTAAASSPGQKRPLEKPPAMNAPQPATTRAHTKLGPKKPRAGTAEKQQPQPQLSPSQSLPPPALPPPPPPTLPSPPPPPPTPTPTPTVTTAITKGFAHTGFLVPPGILSKTGSHWDASSGRRLSRRFSAGFPSYAPTPDEPESQRRSLHRRRVSAGAASAATAHVETSARKTLRSSLGNSSTVAQIPDSQPSPASVAIAIETPATAPAPTPIPAPAPRRATRSSLGEQTAAPLVRAPNPDPVPTPATSNQHSTTIITPAHRLTRSAERKTPRLFNFHHSYNYNHETASSPLPPPPSPPPLPVRKMMRRSLRGSDTPVVGDALASPWVVEETPQQNPKSEPKPNSGRVVAETPQPAAVAAAAAAARRRTVTRSVGRKVNVNVNPEFEFSDGGDGA